MNWKNIVFLGVLGYSALLVTVITALVVVSLSSFSIQTAIDMAIAIFLLLPVKFFYEQMDDLLGNLWTQIRKHRAVIAVAAVLFCLSGYGYLYGLAVPGLWFFYLSFRVSAQVLIPLQQELAMFPANGALITIAQWSVHLVWIVLLTSMIADILRPIRHRIAQGSDTTLSPRFLPLDRHSGDADATISIYVVTGVHGIFWIPHRFCKECHLFVSTVDDVIADLEQDVSVSVRSYWGWLPWVLANGGTHPPCLYINGRQITQGEDVPSRDDVLAALTDDEPEE